MVGPSSKGGEVIIPLQCGRSALRRAKSPWDPKHANPCAFESQTDDEGEYLARLAKEEESGSSRKRQRRNGEGEE